MLSFSVWSRSEWLCFLLDLVFDDDCDVLVIEAALTLALPFVFTDVLPAFALASLEVELFALTDVDFPFAEAPVSFFAPALTFVASASCAAACALSLVSSFDFLADLRAFFCAALASERALACACS